MRCLQMNNENLSALRSAAIKNVRKNISGNILDPEDVVHNAIVRLLSKGKDLKFLNRKSVFQAIDDLRKNTAFDRKEKVAKNKSVQLSEACIDIAYQEKSNQMSEDDLLDFYNRYRLSTAEAKVVETLVDNSIAETADKLKIKEITVRTHINNIRRKISVSNDAERLLKQTAS